MTYSVHTGILYLTVPLIYCPSVLPLVLNEGLAETLRRLSVTGHLTLSQWPKLQGTEII